MRFVVITSRIFLLIVPRETNCKIMLKREKHLAVPLHFRRRMQENTLLAHLFCPQSILYPFPYKLRHHAKKVRQNENKQVLHGINHLPIHIHMRAHI